MERIRALIARFGRILIVFSLGIIVIAYSALGFLYLQQAPQQRDYNDQINKLSIVLRTPLSSADSLIAEYNEIGRKLASISDAEAIAMLVKLARSSGIDVTENSGKLQIPIPTRGNALVGGDTYQTLVFRGIHVQGEQADVTSFTSALDSGAILENMVLTALISDFVDVAPVGADAQRRTEYAIISQAVKDMMADNGLTLVPNPFSAIFGRATNRLGDDPDTLGIFEGFPDNKTTAAEKGYTGNATPKGGYLLNLHDKINSDNTTLYTTANYTQMLSTNYYYTAEDNGTIRQWSNSNLAVATEYTDHGPTKREMRATIDVIIYFRIK